MSTPKQRIARIPDIIRTALENGWKPEYEDDDGYFHYREYRNADGAALNIDNDGTDSCFMYVTRKEDDNGRCYSFCRYELTLGETEAVAALTAGQLCSFLDQKDPDQVVREEYSEREVMDNFNDRRGAVMATRAKSNAAKEKSRAQ